MVLSCLWWSWDNVQFVPSCMLASKQWRKKCLCQKTQDPMKLIELVKALSLYANSRVDLQYKHSKNSNSMPTSKRMWMQKACHKLACLTWFLCFISWLFGQNVLLRKFSAFHFMHFIHVCLGVFKLFLLKKKFEKSKTQKDFFCIAYHLVCN